MIKKNLKTLATFVKRGLAVAAICAVSLPAFAEGYQINSQSTRQEGMGHTGVALKLGAESMLFNPAGMAFMNSKWDISLGVTGISSKVKHSQGNYKAETDNPLSTPLFGYIGYKPCKNLAVGVSITNPAGNSVVWPDSWAGSGLIQEISLKSFSVQPTVSYKFGDIVSVGAGLMIDFGDFKQKKSLVAAGAFDQLGALASMLPQFGSIGAAIQSFAGQDVAGIELSGDSKVSVGVNIGVLVNISPKVSIGASYRSKVKMTVEEGSAELYYANDNAKSVVNTFAGLDFSNLAGALPPAVASKLDVNSIKAQQMQLQAMNVLDGAGFEVSLPIPSITSIGVAYKPTEKWTVTGDFQYTGWSAYDKLVVKFDESTGNYTLVSHKGYDDSFAIRVGGEWVVSDFATVRLGSYIDTTPVQEDNYNPETPGALVYCATAGASLSPLKFFTIDIAFAYLTGKTMHASCADVSRTGVYSGTYKKSAFMPAIGLRFKF